MLERVGNIDFILTAIVAGVCGVAWAFAGFPHFAEVAAPAGVTVLCVGAFLWAISKKE